MATMIDQTISHYRIVEKLGTGGWGEVYSARESRLDRASARLRSRRGPGHFVEKRRRRAGVVAVAGRRYRVGLLARFPLGGGGPKIVLKDVESADWSPEANDLPIAHYISEKRVYRLEYPIGKVLYETSGWIGNVRLSPDGKTLAFVDHLVFGETVVAVHRGPYNCMNEAHDAIRKWMAANRREPAGHSWEIYGDPTPYPADTETMVAYLLK